MSHQITCSIIKPDVAEKGVAGEIIATLEANEFRILGCKKVRLTTEQAEAFYAVHAERPFYGELVQFMTSGPVYVLCLQGEDAVKRYRALMGPTNSETARVEAPESLRSRFGTDLQCNAVHGSDSEENGILETDFFFSELDRV
ncbi:MAG: nucleoside-diphosphate kinase [Myxococcota bacterium]|jgi:nucleoside-diphosphate kinase|nr:nucleoside-diphosphate kinase [Myxococcota bacterium]